MRNEKTKKMVLFSMFVTIEAILAFTPLGFLKVGFLNITMLHIPVLVCGMLLGKYYGAALGFFMGLCSFLNATFQPTITSFCFSPFFSMGEVSGNWTSLLIAFVPRTLLGFVSGWLYEKLTMSTSKKACLCSICGTWINTIGVLGGIYIFFKAPYEAVLGKSIFVLFLSSVGINAVVETIVAAIVCTAIMKTRKAS